MSNDIRRIEYDLHECCVQLQGVLDFLGYGEGEDFERLEEAKRTIADKHYTVAVMGEFKRGKSTLINSLLGQRILPADVEPTTATLNRITYGVRPQVIVHFEDGTQSEIGLTELADYVTKQAADGHVRAGTVHDAEIRFPVPLTQNHVDIFDTPGLNDDRRMTQIALRMVEEADMVLIPISAISPYSEIEQDFVRMLIRDGGIDSIMFVVTFLDMLGEDGFDYDYRRFMYGPRGVAWRIQNLTYEGLEDDPEIQARAHRLLDEVNLSAVSPKQALDAFVSNDRALLEESRFEEFQQRLVQSLTARQVVSMGNKVASAVRTVADNLKESHAERVRELRESPVEESSEALRLRAFVADTKALFEREAAAAREGALSEIRRLYGLKNVVAKLYLTAIGTRRSQSGAALKERLIACAKTRDEQVEFSVGEARRAVLEIFDGIIAQVVDLEMQVREGGEYPGELFLGSNPLLLDGLAERVGTDRRWPVLAWDTLTLIPDYKLATMNLTDEIIDRVDESVDELVRAGEGLFESILEAYRKTLDAYWAGLVGWADAELRVGRAAREREAEVYEGRFCELSSMLERVIERTERTVAQIERA